jgi:integrase
MSRLIIAELAGRPGDLSERSDSPHQARRARFRRRATRLTTRRTTRRRIAALRLKRLPTAERDVDAIRGTMRRRGFSSEAIEAALGVEKASWKDDEYLLTTVRNHRTASGQRLGDYPLTTITEDELEGFHAAQRAAGRAASTLNHVVQVLKAAFRWAVRKGYVPRSPISAELSLKRSKMAKRTRRLLADEEAALLAAASPRLQRLIVGALETGMRVGELLDLTWRDVTRTSARPTRI